MLANITTHDLIENFSLFDDWEERYAYLIELGGKLPPMDDGDKADANKVQGCTSQVWMTSWIEDGGRFHFVADSDAHIVKGLIALLFITYNGKTGQEIAQTDIEDVFSQLGLDQHLSPNRRNGFFAMVERIKHEAQAAV